MIKIQKIVTTMATAAMVLGMLSAILAPVVPANALVTPTDLGVEYGAATGLGSSDVRTTIASIIKVALGLLGIVAVVIILIGGFKWMTAGGNEEQAGEARKWIFSGVIGMAIILSAYALANFVIKSLVTATTAPTP